MNLLVNIPILFHHLDVERYGAETIVAREHCRVWVAHPTIEKVAATLRKLAHEGFERRPRTLAHRSGTLAVLDHEALPEAHIARVLDRILILRHQILIARDAHNRNSNFSHSYRVGLMKRFVSQRRTGSS